LQIIIEPFFKKFNPEPRKNKRSHEDYTEIFLSCARLYLFADYHGITNLKLLSLHKLQGALTVFILYEDRIKDIVQLV